MIQAISIQDLKEAGTPLLIDVRSPAEYERAHIPGAVNIPLFSNEERIKVGTMYKQQGREEAILLGLELTGNKWASYIRQCLALHSGRDMVIHCWRGGMRSGAMAWIFNLYGFRVKVLSGGYKEYRRWAHRIFDREYELRILGGMTGAGKTRMLHELKNTGEQVIDLEDLACHCGSSYGTLNKLKQPTQEQFENNLAEALYQLRTDKILWMEDECQKIGKCGIPAPLWQRMRKAWLIDMQVPAEQRIENLVNIYGVLDPQYLVECTERIRKRVGPEQTKHAVQAIKEDRMSDFIRIVLEYYDKTYQRGLNRRSPASIIPLTIEGTDYKKEVHKIKEAFPEGKISIKKMTL